MSDTKTIAIVFRRCFLTSPGIFYFKNATVSVKKGQAEQPADTNQVGGDFPLQPATFDNPGLLQQLLDLWMAICIMNVKALLKWNNNNSLVHASFGLFEI